MEKTRRCPRREFQDGGKERGEKKKVIPNNAWIWQNKIIIVHFQRSPEKGSLGLNKAR